MIDIDPQTNLTFLSVPYQRWARRKRNTGTIKDLYDRYTKNQTLDIKRFVWNDPIVVGRYPISGLDLIPCDIDLLGEDVGGRSSCRNIFHYAGPSAECETISERDVIPE